MESLLNFGVYFYDRFWDAVELGDGLVVFADVCCFIAWGILFHKCKPTLNVTSEYTGRKEYVMKIARNFAIGLAVFSFFIYAPFKEWQKQNEEIGKLYTLNASATKTAVDEKTRSINLENNAAKLQSQINDASLNSKPHIEAKPSTPLADGVGSALDMLRKQDRQFSTASTTIQGGNGASQQNLSIAGDNSGPIAQVSNSPGAFVNQDVPQDPDWKLSASEIQPSGEWRTEFSATARGNLAIYNWNVVLFFDNDVLRNDVNVSGMAMVQALDIKMKDGQKPPANIFFIGYKEIDPGSKIHGYIYSKAPLRLLANQKVPQSP